MLCMRLRERRKRYRTTSHVIHNQFTARACELLLQMVLCFGSSDVTRSIPQPTPDAPNERVKSAHH